MIENINKSCAFDRLQYNMGQSNSVYQNGDVTRDTIGILNNSGCGYAYYSSSTEGKCSVCCEPTNWWFVSIKSRGVYICKLCKYHDKVNILDTNLVIQSIQI